MRVFIIIIYSLGKRCVRQLPDSLLHRHGGRDEGDLHVQSHVEVVREELPPRHGRRLQRHPRSQARGHGPRALRDAHPDGHHHGLLQQPVLGSEHDHTGKNGT